MRLVRSTKLHIREIMSWFPDQQTCAQWGGPAMRFPFTEERFLEDIHWGKMPSYSAVSDEYGLLGFGQFYEKLGRCHLARLAIAPQLRGQGLGKTFISSLMKISADLLGLNEFSLYVLEWNTSAVCCYQSLGFRQVKAPEVLEGLEDCIFMITAFD
jgi:ribosomal protein S18 acetylase RimI-like enzyme